LRNIGDLPPEWEPATTDIRRFRLFAEELEIKTTDEDFERATPFVKRRTMQAVYTSAVHVDEGARVDAQLDPTVLAAAALLTKAAQLRSSDTAVARALPLMQ
jgi:hypothetical protein